jgi:Skp family chaperone for outer membrane proteins
MSRLKELVNRGVRLIVVETPEADASTGESPVREREIPAEAFEAEAPPAASSTIPADVEEFSSVYAEAGVAPPDHGYGIDKVAEMLQGKRLAGLARELKATAVLAALEAAGVATREIIQDAVRRDNALDLFEAAKQREVQELRARNEARVKSLQDEMEGLLRKINAEIEKLRLENAQAALAFEKLQERKRREEQRLFDVVSHFVEGADNPVTSGARPGVPPGPRDV